MIHPPTQSKPRNHHMRLPSKHRISASFQFFAGTKSFKCVTIMSKTRQFERNPNCLKRLSNYRDGSCLGTSICYWKWISFITNPTFRGEFTKSYDQLDMHIMWYQAFLFLFISTQKFHFSHSSWKQRKTFLRS